MDSTLSEQDIELDIHKTNQEIILNPKYIPVRPWMIREGYSYLDCIVYGFIDFFLSTNDKFYCSNEQIGKMLATRAETISRSIKKLKEDGLIEIHHCIKSGGGQIRYIKMGEMGEHFTPLKNKKEVVIEDKDNKKDAVGEGDIKVKEEKKEVKEVKEDKEVEDKNKKRQFDNKTKRLYGDYVSLTDEEYAHLVYSFGRTEFVKDEKNHILKLAIHSKVVDDMIDNVNDRIDEKGNKAKYKDYYKALLKRFRNRKISTYYEYDNWNGENEKVEHFKTDPQGNLALRYKRDHCKKKKDILDFYRLADKCGYSLTQNFDFLTESDEEKRKVEMYTDGWLVKDREW